MRDVSVRTGKATVLVAEDELHVAEHERELPNDDESFEKALQMVKDVTAVPELNKVYTGKVAKIVEFGAFVTILPNQDGLLHVSEIAHERVNKVEDYLKEGEEIEVKVLGIDRGRIKLSRKVLIDK